MAEARHMWPDHGAEWQILFPGFLRLLRPEHSPPACHAAESSRRFFANRSSRWLWLLRIYLTRCSRTLRSYIRNWKLARCAHRPGNIARLSRSLRAGHKSPRDSSPEPRRWDTFDGKAATFAGYLLYLRSHGSSVP